MSSLDSAPPRPYAPSGSTVTEPLIQAVNLHKAYGSVQAVRNLSFAVRRGEVVGFLGPNGAGKSTTMKLLTGYLRPSAGRAHIAGFDVAQHALQARRSLGYLPENAPLYDEMMVLDFLEFICALRGVVGAQKRVRLSEVVERCGLGEALHKDIGALSKGYRQRVGLAQALVHDPDLLILDEPTSGLDPNQIVDIRALIRDLGRDKTVLLSTHILSEVRAVCSRALIIAGGRLVADDTPQALEHRGGHDELSLGLRARDNTPLDVAAVHAALAAVPGVAGVVQAPAQEAQSANLGALGCSFVLQCAAGAEVRPALFELAVARGWCVMELRLRQASLEQTFQRLTAAEAKHEGRRHAA